MAIDEETVNAAYDALQAHMNGPGAYSGVAFSTEGIHAAIEAAVMAERERAAKIASEWSITIMGDGAVDHREAEQIAMSGFAGIADAIRG